MKIPAAKKALGKEWGKLTDKKAWLSHGNGEKADVIAWAEKHGGKRFILALSLTFAMENTVGYP